MRVEAFEQVYLEEQGRIVNYLYRNGVPWEDARDLMHETFARTWRHWAKVVPGGERAFVWRVASNLLIDWSRRLRFSPVAFDLKLHDRADERNVVEHILHQEQLAVVQRAFRRLPERDQQLLWSYYHDGVPINIQAKQQGVHSSLLKTRAHRARERMRPMVESYLQEAA